MITKRVTATNRNHLILNSAHAEQDQTPLPTEKKTVQGKLESLATCLQGVRITYSNNVFQRLCGCDACMCTCVHMFVGIHLGAPVPVYSHTQRCQRPIYVFLGMCPSTLFTGAKSVLNLKLTFLAIRLRSPVFISQILGLEVDYQTLLAFFFK